MLRRIVPALAALALVPSLAACGTDDDAAPAPSATPATDSSAPAVLVTTTRTSSGSSCSKVPNNAHTSGLLISGIVVEGGSATFDGPTAAPDDVVSVSYAAGRGSSLTQGAVLPGVPRDARAIWSHRKSLLGATLQPGHYWVFTRVTVDNHAQVDTVSLPWHTATDSGVMTDHWNTRWDVSC
jgi:predicted small lipoprotein YifL